MHWSCFIRRAGFLFPWEWRRKTLLISWGFYLNGIDTPEIRGKCPREKHLARRARQQVHSLLINARSIELRNIKRGKYFRIVADVWVDGHSLKQVLVHQKLAVPYLGGKKTVRWCD